MSKEEIEFIIPKEIKELKKGCVYAVRMRKKATHDLWKAMNHYLHKISERSGIEFVLLPYDIEVVDKNWKEKDE